MMQIKEAGASVWLSVRMWRPLQTPLMLCLAAGTLLGCADVTDYALGDAVDFQEIEEVVKRGEAEEVLGEPDAVRDVEGRRIDAYEIYGGTRFLYIVGIPPFIPIDSRFYYLTIAYESDGSLLEMRRWDNIPTSAEAAIDLHVDHLAEVLLVRFLEKLVG